MKLTVKHYYHFGKKAKEVGRNLLSESSWDAVRINDENNETPFSIPEKREDWIKKCVGHEQMVKRAEAIGQFANKKGFKKIISFGCGACFMEYNLKKQYPNIVLECSDFSPNSVRRLKEIFIESEKIYTFDMLKDGFKNENGLLYLFHRLDADFGNRQWKDIFKRASDSGVESILFVPCAVDTLKSLAKAIIGRWYQVIIKRSKLSFAGYLRNKDELKHLFLSYYDLSEELNVGDLKGFFLKIKK